MLKFSNNFRKKYNNSKNKYKCYCNKNLIKKNQLNYNKIKLNKFRLFNNQVKRINISPRNKL